MSVGAAVTLLSVATLLLLAAASPDEDFAFDSAPDDLETEIGGGSHKTGHLVAPVGRVFRHKAPFAKGPSGDYQAKKSGNNLPPWLLFDKTEGIFWGLPLSQDVGVVHLNTWSTKGKSQHDDITIKIVESDEDAPGIEDCLSNEDKTVLTLLLDKNVRAIKPKQRVIAVNNIAKFFGLPYSAFTLKPQIEKDDITDSSIVLAGPGNLQSRSSKSASLLQVPVGCDGRLWLSTASVIHQLKQQARDGTIAEVLRLPLIGWRVKTETKPAVREKRQTTGDDDFGSGDYNDEDEYYDDYEDYDPIIDSKPVETVSKDIKATVTPKTTTTTTTAVNSNDYESYDNNFDDYVEENVPEIPYVPTTLSTEKVTVPTTVSTTSTTTSTTAKSTTHPHRHHHGELNPSETISREHHQTTHKITSIDTVPVTDLPTTVPIVTTTPQPAPTLVPTRPKSTNPDNVLNYEDNYDYGDYDDEDDDGPEESETVIPNLAIDPKKLTTVPDITVTESTTTEDTVTVGGVVVPETQPPTTTGTTSSSTLTTTLSTTTTTISPTITAIKPSTTTTEPPTTFQIVEDDGPEVFTTINQYPTTMTESSTPMQQTTSTLSTTTTTTSSTTLTKLSSAATTEILPVTEKEEETTVKLTTLRQVPSTTPVSTTPVKDITEIEYHDNFEPFIENRLKQMSVIAGKIFRFVIPLNTFRDFEDEYNLSYQLLDSTNRTISNNTWLHFNPQRREVYGLPLEEEVSKWVFWVKAYDREGGSVQEKLNIQVQQHKLDLVVNHEFSLHIRIEKQQEFTHFVDWSLKVLRALGKIYNTNMSEITVRRINYTNEPVIFTWSNDSIPTNYCPKTEIEDLFKVLTANDRGDPSRELNLALAPELRVKKVVYHELGVCEQPQTPVTPPMNFSPILRNPVDNVNATVGELLIYKVKDDTFYDPEDVDPSMLNISLLTSDRQPLPPDSWLQFDNKNREFFGIPRKPGRSEYQLVCVDSGGLPASDSLEVIVHAPPKRHYNVEFSMNITEIPYQTFVNSANLQKKFVEKLMRLFGESNPGNIHFLPFKQTYESTIVTWFNKSLPINRCPNEEIKRLESVLHNMNDKSISHKVHAIMEPEFRVSTIKVHPVGNCKPKVIHEPRPEISVPIEESTPQSSGDEYLITFIVPAVIIAVMLFLAAVAAVVLYRRRRMGKLNVEEDGRQSYGNKGIPVIFQEELEEKPEPGTKAPVILKDEKPPLAPPEYSKSGSLKLTDDSEPYQPPPPFARSQDNGRQPRPKPTPTYRKPPPYVPP